MRRLPPSLLAALGLLLCRGTPQAQTANPQRITAVITYVTASGVYVGAGRAMGLAPGDTLTLRRPPAILGKVLITAVSSSSSLATVLEPGLIPLVGDSVEIWKALTAAPPVVSPVLPVTARMSTEQTENIISGRIGVQYSGAGRRGDPPDLSQPALVGRLDVDRLFGSTMALRVNGRLMADMTAHYERYGEHSRLRPRMYEFSLSSGDPRQRYGFGLGRIFPRFASGLGTVDGGELYGRLGRFTAGVIAGLQANYSTSGLDPDHQKLAAFANVSWGRDIWDRSDLTLAYGQQLFKGKLDRNFTYLQASVRMGPAFAFYGSTEFDFHKASVDGVVPKFNMTNTFVSLSYSPSFSWFTLNAGFDATRPVPLIESERTRLDSLLDRSLRQGLRGSVTFQLPARVSVTGTATYRMPSRTTPRAGSVYASLRVSDLFDSGISLGAQAGAVSGVYARGNDLAADLDLWTLDALAVGVRIGHYAYVQVDRDERHRTTSASLNLSWRISRVWYATVSTDRVWEDEITTQRLYVELGMHF